MKYLMIFFTVIFIEFVLIPYAKKIADIIGFVDIPTRRKDHKYPVALSGGISIFIGFVIGYIIFIRHFNTKSLLIAVAAFLVLAIGFVDDWYKSKGKDFSAAIRLGVHIVASIIVILSGTCFHGFTIPLTNGYVVFPNCLQYIFTIIWIVGVTTVINWSDGLDGLAGGISVISGCTLFIVALTKGRTYSAVMAIMLVAVVLGFLKYNKHPAQIYMGDSGANFLGFMLAVIALDGALKQATIVSIFIPILALGVPIFDNLFVVIKRYLNGKPIYEADKSQIHYRLQLKGLNPTQSVTFILLISTCLSLLSIIILLLQV
jgi:UDP-GlcNAc:undecaprenyl-phosphate/decaprenyl-phosphate GlcNAc-1-phosphate transferase